MRRLRKHRLALLGLTTYLFIVFFPTIFMSRVVSPNDVFYNYNPWSSQRVVDVQNSVLNDPPTSYLTLMAMLKNDRGTFDWNPYVGSGIPGFGSSAAAVLSPFIAIPALTLPLSWVYTGIIVLKLLAGFLFAYLWLREERLGKRAAALGAIVFAASGIYAVRWLWQVTNATPLYPALLWIVSRMTRGKRTSFGFLSLIFLTYALSGFPATMAYGVYVATAYFLYLTIRERRFRLLLTLRTLLAAALALLIAAPSLVPFIQFILRTGYLGVREAASLTIFFPGSHWRGFFAPDRLGNPAYHNWLGEPGITNYVEATIYLGIVGIPLALAGLFNHRARHRWYWSAVLAILVCCMFGWGGFPKIIAQLPGLKYSPLTRLQMLLPVPFAYLVACGTAMCVRLSRRTSWRDFVAAVLLVAAVADLGVFAGRFFPYLEEATADIPATPTIAFLQRQPGPFRIAPFFDYLWPNSAELFHLEDVRSHFSSEALYRRMLQRLDPTVWGGHSTVLQFNSLKFAFEDPLAGMLGIRYYIEQKSIDILRWHVFSSTVPGVKEIGGMVLPVGATIQREIVVDAEPFYAVELPLSVTSTYGPVPRVIVSLLRNGSVVYSRALSPADITALGKSYIPLRPYARLGDVVVLRLQSIGVLGKLLTGAVSHAGDAPIFYGRVTTPLIFDRELEDGRVFRNLSEVPRFHGVSRLRWLSDSVFLDVKDIDFAEEAVIGDPHAAQPAALAAVNLRSYSAARQELDVDSVAAAFVASSEKLTPELAITVDGSNVTPVRINGLFAGVPVPAGHHRVVFTKRIARGWWWPSAMATLVCLMLSCGSLVRERRRRRQLFFATMIT